MEVLASSASHLSYPHSTSTLVCTFVQGQVSMRKRLVRNLGLLAILLLAFALRMYRLDELSLRDDEAATVFEAALPWAELWPILTQPRPQQPLYELLLHVWMRLFGDGPIAVRFISVSSGVLLVALAHALARLLFPERPAVARWAALMACLHPMLLWEAQDNRMYALLGALCLCSCCFAIALLRGRGWRHVAGYVLVTALALYTHYLAALVVLAQNVIWAALVWGQPRRAPRLVRWMIAQGVTLAVLTPWMARSLGTAATFRMDILPRLSVLDTLHKALVGLTFGFPVEVRLGTYLALGMLGACLLGAWRGLRGHEAVAVAPPFPQRASSLVLLIYVCLPLALMAVFSWWRFPIFDENYIAISIPPYLLLASSGVASLVASALGARGVASRIRASWPQALLVGWILGADAFVLHSYLVDPRFMKGGLNWRAYVARLLACSEPGDLLVQNYPDPALTYHLEDRVPSVLLPAEYPLDAPKTEGELERLLAGHTRLWAQPQRYAQWDDQGLVATWLERRAVLVAEERFDNARLELYLTPQAYLTRMQRSEVYFAAPEPGGIRLLAWALEREQDVVRRCVCDAWPSPMPSEVHPGERLILTCAWQAQAAVTASYTVFVHCYGEGMQLISQQDGPPVQGSYPTTRWAPGEIVVDRRALEIPQSTPSGDYRLVTGMYRLETMERLPVRTAAGVESGDTLTLATFEVVAPER